MLGQGSFGRGVRLSPVSTTFWTIPDDKFFIVVEVTKSPESHSLAEEGHDSLSNEDLKPQLVNEIIANVLEELSKGGTFDKGTLERLRTLADSHEWTTFAKVVSAISAVEEC